MEFLDIILNDLLTELNLYYTVVDFYSVICNNFTRCQSVKSEYGQSNSDLSKLRYLMQSRVIIESMWKKAGPKAMTSNIFLTSISSKSLGKLYVLICCASINGATVAGWGKWEPIIWPVVISKPTEVSREHREMGGAWSKACGT